MPLPFCLPFRCISWVEVLDKSQRNLKEVPPAVDRLSDTLLEINLDGNQITELNSVCILEFVQEIAHIR